MQSVTSLSARVRRAFLALLVPWVLVGHGCGDNLAARDPGLPAITYDDPLTLDSSLATGVSDGVSGIEEVRALADGRVVYCTSRAGVVVVDATDPRAMTEKTRLATGPCQHVAVSGDVLYVAHRGDASDSDSRISVWNLADPPAPITTFRRPGTSFEGMTAAGDLLYVAAHEHGVLVLERVADTLVERGALDSGFGNAWDVIVHDTTAYVADATGGFATVDVADPAQPVLLGQTAPGAIEGSPMSLAQDDSGIVYVGAGYGGIAVVDARDPSAPRVTA